MHTINQKVLMWFGNGDISPDDKQYSKQQNLVGGKKQSLKRNHLKFGSKLSFNWFPNIRKPVCNHETLGAPINFSRQHKLSTNCWVTFMAISASPGDQQIKVIMDKHVFRNNAKPLGSWNTIYLMWHVALSKNIVHREFPSHTYILQIYFSVR